MNPAMRGASEEDKHRVLGGSYTYERRLLRFISWPFGTSQLQELTVKNEAM